MGFQIVKQPDGRLAIFSSYVDQWVACDASDEEVILMFAEQAAESSRLSIGRSVAAILEGRERELPGFHYTIEELDARSLRHGGKTLADLIASAPPIEAKVPEPDWRALLAAVIDSNCHQDMEMGDCQACGESCGPRCEIRHKVDCPWAAAEKALGLAGE
jgi:hypothetical protein